VLISRTNRIELTTGRVLRGFVIEASLLAIVALILRARGWTRNRLGLDFSIGSASAGLLLFVAYIGVYWMTGLAVLSVAPAAAKAHAFQFVIRAHPAAMMAFIVINSFYEEIVVAGYVVTALSKQGAALAITASTLLRFSYHLYQGPLASITILPLGLLFGAVYWRWRNLWPLIVAHTITNIISFMLLAQRS
jgi:membrane protease YdiL (CAAX protease family)